jgi:hypothetical protein
MHRCHFLAAPDGNRPISMRSAYLGEMNVRPVPAHGGVTGKTSINHAESIYPRSTAGNKEEPMKILRFLNLTILTGFADSGSSIRRLGALQGH